MIDTHCHILPGVDDGAADDQAALAMARVAAADGIRCIVVTPHMRAGDYDNKRDDVLARLQRLRGVVHDAGISLELRPGAEVHLTPELLGGIRSGRFLTVNNLGRHLLLECPYRTRPIRLEETIFELKVAGVTPVMAHPERIRYFQEDLSRYEEVVRLGALGQMTASSLTGDFGATIAALAERMVRRRLVHVLASDAHDDDYRPPRLSAARRRWAELADEDAAESATVTLPQALLDGATITPPSPLEEERGRGFLGRLLGRR